MRIAAAVWRGVRLGGGIGAVLAVFALVVALLQGSTRLQFRGDSTANVFAVAAVYLAGGMAAGIIGGLLHRLTRWTIGAAAVGVMASVPMSLGVAISMLGFSPWTGGHTFVTACLSVLLGGFLGITYSKMLRD